MKLRRGGRRAHVRLTGENTHDRREEHGGGHRTPPSSRRLRPYGSGRGPVRGCIRGIPDPLRGGAPAADAGRDGLSDLLFPFPLPARRLGALRGIYAFSFLGLQPPVRFARHTPGGRRREAARRHGDELAPVRDAGRSRDRGLRRVSLSAFVGMAPYAAPGRMFHTDARACDRSRAAGSAGCSGNAPHAGSDYDDQRRDGRDRLHHHGGRGRSPSGPRGDHRRLPCIAPADTYDAVSDGALHSRGVVRDGAAGPLA